MATTNSSFKVKNSLEVLGGAAAAANTGSVLNSSDTSGAGQQGYGLRLLNTVNQTSTAAYTDLFINRTQTAAGSGAQLLIDLQVASVSKFKVTNTGEVTTSGNINVGGSGYIYGELVGSASEVTFNNPLVPGTEWPLLIASPSATYGSTQSVYLFDQITIQPSSGRITAPSFAGSLTGNADTATTATHKSGGGAGQILYQTAAATTAFIGAGSNTNVLETNGTTPAWVATSGTGSVARVGGPTFTGTAAFAALSATGQFTSTLASGTAPLVIASTTLVTNLNADMLDGKHTGTSGNTIPLLDGTNTFSGVQSFSNSINITGGTLQLGGAVALRYVATSNVFGGYNSGNGTVSGSGNTAWGVIALDSVTSGTDNCAFGNNAGRNISSGSYNTATGSYSQDAASHSSDYNTSVGYNTLTALTGSASDYNTALGSGAGSALTTSSTDNTLIGYNTGTQIVSGSTFCTFLGSGANLSNSTQRSYATAIGAGALVNSANTIVLGRTTDTTVIGAAASDGSSALLQVTGNIKVIGTQKRFLADTQNATIGNRFFFQDSTTNSDSSFFAIPNGTAQTAYIGGFNSSDPANGNYVFFACAAGLASMEVGALGAAGQIPFAISVGTAAGALQISTTGYTHLNRTDTSSSGSANYGTGITHTINQTSTAGFTDLYINRTQTAAGSGAQYLIDAQVGSASKFSVTNTGNVTATRFIGLVPPFELTRYASGYHDFVGTGSQNGYGIGASGTGAAVNELEPDGNRVGTAQFQLGTVATNSCYVATDGRAILAGGGALTCENCFKIDFLSDGTNTYTVYAGFQDSYLAAPTDGMFFRYTHGTNSGKWQAVTRSNGTETATDTGTTASTAAWNTFRVECNAGGTSVVFKINGTTVATNTTNIPTGAGRNFGHALWVIRSAGTASLAAVNVDYVWWVKEFTTAR